MSEVREKLEELQSEEAIEPGVEHSEERSEIEQEALAEGWKPDGKDKDGNTLSAEEYMARKPLFNKINNLTTELNDIKGMLKTVQSESKKMAQSFNREKEDLVAQLEAKKEKALDDLDTDAVREIDKQIKEVNQTQAYTMQDWSEGFVGFLKTNAWYDTNPGLKAAADSIGDTYREQNPNSSPEELYGHVAERMRKEFGDRIEKGGDQTTSVSKVSSVNRRTTSQKTQKTHMTPDDLADHEERRIYQTMANALGVSLEDYLKRYPKED